MCLRYYRRGAPHHHIMIVGFLLVFFFFLFFMVFLFFMMRCRWWRGEYKWECACLTTKAVEFLRAQSRKGFIIIIIHHRHQTIEFHFSSMMILFFRCRRVLDFRYSTSELCAYVCVFLWRSCGSSSEKLLQKKIFAENFHGKFPP